MSEVVLNALERSEKAKKARRQGYIPGVVYGRDIESESIKLDQREFRRALQGRPITSRIKLKLGDEIKNCIIKEIQKDPINGQILHVDFQTIRSDQVIRLKVPVVFEGKEKLGSRQELLHEFINEVEIMGKAADLPEFISIDVGDRRLGDKITVSDINATNFKVMEEPDEVIAVVTAARIEAAEESTEETAGETAAAAEQTAAE
mgnify:CR=1 FL=1